MPHTVVPTISSPLAIMSGVPYMFRFPPRSRNA